MCDLIFKQASALSSTGVEALSGDSGFAVDKEAVMVREREARALAALG